MSMPSPLLFLFSYLVNSDQKERLRVLSKLREDLDDESKEPQMPLEDQEPLDSSDKGYQPRIDESLVKEFDPKDMMRGRGGTSKGKSKGKGKSSKGKYEDDCASPSKGKGKGKSKGKSKSKSKHDDYEPKERESLHPSVFGEQGREGFLQHRVHRMLQAQARSFSDAKLLKFGGMSFKEQFTFLGVAGPKEQSGKMPTNLFGDMGRTGYIQRQIHRRLHEAIQGLADEDVFALGQKSFNEQFRTLGQDKTVDLNGNPFGKESRESYIQIHVHRKLHSRVAKMSDEEVFNLGKLGFNKQFRTLSVDAAKADEVNFQAGRAAYIQQHIHRRLRSRAAQLSDKDLLDLGKLSFNEQFVVLQTPGPKEEEQQELFGDAGRDGYLQQRIHRMLHSQVANMSDRDLFHLGELSFNKQFTAMGCPRPQQMDAMKSRHPSSTMSGAEAAKPQMFNIFGDSDDEENAGARLLQLLKGGAKEEKWDWDSWSWDQWDSNKSRSWKGEWTKKSRGR